MEFFNPVKIIQGSGVRKKIIEECADKKVLIFCTKSAYERYKQDYLLKELFKNPQVSLEHAFSSNPSISDITLIGQKYRYEPIDIIIGLGGGSSMDVAKIACVSIPAQQNNIEISSLLLDSKLFASFNAIACFQVPTTAGTGSEVTPFSTIWDYENQEKKSLSHSAMFAKKAFIDPDLLLDLPLEIALSTGLDALNQAFESIWNKNTTSASSLYAIHSAQLSLDSIPHLNIMNQSSNVRQQLSEASLYAGVAISQTRTSICHSISYPLTLKFNLPHGLACAFSMLAVYDFNKDYISNQIGTIAAYIKNDPRKTIEDIFTKYDLVSILGRYIKSKEQVLSVTKDMIAPGRFDNNIRPCGAKELLNIVDRSCKDLKL